MEQPVNGYVILHEDGKRSLSRSGRWVHHRDRNRDLPGTRRAWVHTREYIESGVRQAGAGSLLPACFDPAIEYTAITGEAITYGEFFDVV